MFEEAQQETIYRNTLIDSLALCSMVANDSSLNTKKGLELIACAKKLEAQIDGVMGFKPQ